MRQLSEFSTSLATNFQKVTLTIYSLHFPLNYPSGETLAHFACLDRNYWISSPLCDERELQSSCRKLVKITSARPFDLLVVFHAFLLPPLFSIALRSFLSFWKPKYKTNTKSLHPIPVWFNLQAIFIIHFWLKYAEVRKNIFFLFHFFLLYFCLLYFSPRCI